MEEPIIEEQPDQWWKGPLKYILALMLILIIILWYFPSQPVKLDPEPAHIPSLDEVIPQDIVLPNKTEVISRQDYLKLITPNNPLIKQTADKIVSLSCSGNKICHAKAIYYFIRDNFQYVSDPTAYEYVKTAQESLLTSTGDCDDAAVLASNLLQAVGIRTRFVFIPKHVYVQAYLPEALKRYKSEDMDYVSLDLTCKTCDFGELPISSIRKERVIVG